MIDEAMVKKNTLILLIGLFVLVSCEKDIYENTNTMSVEQYSPRQENGVMMLSGKVTIPQEFNRETAKVGFYVREFTKDMNNSLEWLFDEYVAVDAYQALMNGEQFAGYYGDDKILWVDGMNNDGTFETSFRPQLKQYVCFAFAINALQWENSECQVLSSKPFFFTGEATPQLKLVDSFAHRFELTFSGESGIEVGLCWSATNVQPNVEDACIHGDYRYGYSMNNVIFDCLDFADNDVVYLRGYVQKRIANDNYSEGTSYKMIYSNVVEFRPKECVVTINSKSDLQDFINSMYVYRYDGYADYYYEYHGDRMWKIFHGKINFNYTVQKEDWIDEHIPAEYGPRYLEVPEIHCLIVGHEGGVIPYVSSVSKSGMIKGMTVEVCDENHGILENLQNSFIGKNYGVVRGGDQCMFRENRGMVTGVSHVVIDSNYGNVLASENVDVGSNYGDLLDSKYVYVSSNYGLVQGCKDAYSLKESEGSCYNMVRVNNRGGRIIDCIIEHQVSVGTVCYICNTNYGYIENSGPNIYCCNYNYGVIKNLYDESDNNGHGTGGDNAGGEIVEAE